MSESLPEKLADATPATKLVYRELCFAEEALTYDDLVARTELGRSTVRRATTRLQEDGLAKRRWHSPQTVCYLSQGGQTDRQNRG